MAMSEHAATSTVGPVVTRRLEPTTICFYEEPAPADTGYRFAVRVTCNVKQSLKFRRSGQHPDMLREKDTGPAAIPPRRSLSVTSPPSRATAPAEGPSAGCWRSYRNSDRSTSPMTSDIVSQIVRVARGDDANDGFTFCFAMKVHRRFIFGKKALLMTCKDREPGSDGTETDDGFPIYLDGLEGEPVMEMPHCKHAFHRRCISTWFSNATTCPLCVGDVRLCALPEFLDQTCRALWKTYTTLAAQHHPITRADSFSYYFGHLIFFCRIISNLLSLVFFVI
jgi:hypothetical protein